MIQLKHLLVGGLLFLTACGGKMTTANELSQKASKGDTLRVAVLAHDTLESIVKELSNILPKKEKRSITLVTYPCYLDSYMALVEGKADLVRIDSIGRKYLYDTYNISLHRVLPLSNEWDMVARKGLKVKNVKQLPNHTIGWNRYTNAELALQKVAQEAHAKVENYPAVLIHSPKMLYEMFENSQIDIAILPRYYSLQAKEKGAVVLSGYKDRKNDDGIYAVDSVAEIFR